MTTACTPREEAEAYLANPRFHQSLTLAACADHGEIGLSYAEYGCAEEGDADAPTILFTPGMFGSRYVGVFTHAIATAHNVRVLVPDRFGFGKTTNIPLDARVKTWTAVIPKFLKALNVKHVALMSHSAGTIYNLNLLWHHRHILHPTRPQIFFFGPFVDVAHSKVPMVRALQVLPDVSYAYWNKIASFFVLRASVMIGFSSGLLAQFAKALTPGNSEPSASNKNMEIMERDYGMNKDTQVELASAVVRGIFGEETVGANLEALGCLKKGPEGLWVEAEDMAVLIDKIAVRERETRREGQENLHVGIYFAKTDAMTGKTGQEYFQLCWTGENGQYDDCFDVSTTLVPNSDHDSVLQAVEALKEVIQLVGEAGEVGE